MVCRDFNDFFDTLGECHTARGDGDNEGGERSERHIPFLLLFAAAIFVIECTGVRKKREGVVRNRWRKNKGRYVDGWQWLIARVGGSKNPSPISAFAIYSLISQCQLDALHTIQYCACKGNCI